jgi:hypothetical protein
VAEEQQPEPAVQINIDQAMLGGVWSNMARVAHSPYEFTIDFARLDFSERRGVVVSRVNMSPLMVSQLIDALQSNWNQYAQKALPQEVYRDGDDVQA